jgi:8-oxo-dGTP pyrophosphatase MutT (NUDIX family)
MAGWQVLSSEEVFKSPWLRVRRDEVLNQNGTPLTYSIAETVKKPSVFIVALNDAGQVFMQKVYRYPVDTTWWEIPAGFSDEPDALAAAKRELQEEADLVSDDWVELGDFFQAPGIAVMPGKAFLARNTRLGNGERDLEEDLGEPQFFDFDQAEEMVRTGEIKDAPTIATLYLARLHNQKEDKS